MPYSEPLLNYCIYIKNRICPVIIWGAVLCNGDSIVLETALETESCHFLRKEETGVKGKFLVKCGGNRSLVFNRTNLLFAQALVWDPWVILSHMILGCMGAISESRLCFTHPVP